MDEEQPVLVFFLITITCIIVFLLIGNGFINMYIMSSCDYHEPINKEPSQFISTFYYLSSGHLEVNKKTNWILWVISGSILGIIIYNIKVFFSIKKLGTRCF